MAFGKPTDSSSFLSGMKGWKHVHEPVEEHEKSIMHKDCAEAYFLWASKADIQNLITNNMMFANREQIRMRREVLERIIDIVKVIGKRELREGRIQKKHILWMTSLLTMVTFWKWSYFFQGMMFV
jgi:hypothetical protein